VDDGLSVLRCHVTVVARVAVNCVFVCVLIQING